MTVATPDRTRRDLDRLRDRADAHALAGDLDAAARLYRQVASEQDHPTDWIALGRLELDRGDAETAARCFRRAGDHRWLARALERQGRIELAWHEALKARPGITTARLQARLAGRLGFHRRGVEILAPHVDPESTLQRARHLDHLGEHREAWLTAAQANRSGTPPAPPAAPAVPSDPDPDREPVLLTGLPGSGVEPLRAALDRHPELRAETVDPRRFAHAAARAPGTPVVQLRRGTEDAAVVAFFRPLADWPRDWPALRAALDTAAAILAEHPAPSVEWDLMARDPEAALRLVLARLGRPWRPECLETLRRELEAEQADQPLGGPAAYARFYREREHGMAPGLALGA